MLTFVLHLLSSSFISQYFELLKSLTVRFITHHRISGINFLIHCVARVGPGHCYYRIGPVHFLAGWRKRRPEPGLVSLR